MLRFTLYSTKFKTDKLMQVFYIQIPSAKITTKDTFEQGYNVVKNKRVPMIPQVLTVTVIQLFITHTATP